MRSCDQFGNSRISPREIIITSILSRFDQKERFLGVVLVEFNNLGLLLGMAGKF